jgi:hypothetical protein
MKQKISAGLICLLSVFTAMIFFNCEHNAKSGGGGEGTITITIKEGEKRYFSLASGEWADASAGTSGWDIGFQRPRSILTNGGDTAAGLSSGGKGMVWYTEKTDFDSVVLSDAVKTGAGALSDYFADKSKWIYSMSTKRLSPLNVINYAGYQTGTGTENSPFQTMLYDQKQFYVGGNGYPVTKVVYIIQHGDGIHYSKIQVSQYEYANSEDSYVIKYETF